MTARATIVALLADGLSDRAISRQVQVNTRRVREVREDQGLPRHQPGRAPAASVEDLFWLRTQPTDDGHLIWSGTRIHNSTPAIRWGGRRQSALRVAFRIRWGRDPVGKVTPGCDRDGCTHPRHVEDQPMREHARRTFAAIFGEDR